MPSKAMIRLLLSDPGLEHSLELLPGVDERQVLAAWPKGNPSA